MHPLVQFLLARAREASTWRGLILSLAGTWALAHPDQTEAVVAIGVALAGAAGAFLPDLLGRRLGGGQ